MGEGSVTSSHVGRKVPVWHAEQVLSSLMNWQVRASLQSGIQGSEKNMCSWGVALLAQLPLSFLSPSDVCDGWYHSLSRTVVFNSCHLE